MLVERKKGRTTLKNNAAVSYKGPVKIELLKGAGLMLQSEGYNPVRCLRSASQNLLAVPKCNLDSCGLRAFSVAAPILWNSPSENVGRGNSLDFF